MTRTRAVWAVFILWLWAPALAHAHTPLEPGNGDAQALKIQPIVLTNQEQAWIKAHPKIRVHLMNWPPFKIGDKVPPKGITVDYLGLICQQVGLEIQWVRMGWAKALKSVQQRRQIDVLPLLTRLPIREKFLRFTRDYVSFPIVIFSRRDDDNFIGDLDDLRYSSIVVERDFAMHYRLRRDLPGSKLLEVDTTSEALHAVASGRVNAYLGNLAVGSYLIQEQGLSNLKVSAPALYSTHDQAMGVRSDWPELARILDKGLAAITHRGRHEIRQQWLGVRYEHGITSTYTMSRLIPVCGVALIALLAILFWNRRLKQEVRERRQVEAALKESQGQLVEAQRLAGIGTWSHDLASGKLTWSPEMFHIFGRSSERSAPDLEECSKAIHADQRQAFIQTWEAAIEANEPFEMEHWIQGGDGKSRYIVCRGAPVENGQGAKGQIYIGTCQDITQRKQQEEKRQQFEAQIRQTQKLESLGVLAGGIAHDFNNILMAIMGNAEMTLLDLPADSPTREGVTDILRASRRAADLCAQMLAYSGRGAFVLKPINLAALVEDMLQMLKVSIAKKATPHFDFGEDLPPVEADPTQMRQVIMNLITNASEAESDQVGDIFVSIKQQKCRRAFFDDMLRGDHLAGGTYVVLEVRDTGCGMSEETLSRIFEPFYSTKFSGRGLGMAAVLGIIRSHKGAINVQSEKDQGSTFTVYLPAITNAGEASVLTPIGAPLAVNANAGLILVVDDEELVRSVARRILSRHGFTVLSAGSGREGLMVIKEMGEDISCVILDLTMPDMDGEETYIELCRKAPNVPVILASGYDKKELEHRFSGFTEQPAAFIHKPFQIETLVTTIKGVLEEQG